MATPHEVFTEMVSTTLRNHPKDVADNVSNHNALMRRLYEKGRYKRASGGYEIVRVLDYAENSTYQRYSGYEMLNIGQSQVISSAKYDWKQVAVHVSASGLELRQNNSKEAMINLVEARLTNAQRTFRNNMANDLYSLGTADGGKQIGGLQAVVTTDGLGTVGGINASTWDFWQNKFKDGNSATAGTIRTKMNELWYDLTRGSDKPDFLVSDTALYGHYENSLQDLQRYQSAKEAEAGFESLKYKSADVFFDSADSGVPANRMYFLNTDFLEIVVHSEADMEQLPQKPSINQDAVTIPILWMGNLVCSNRALQGVLFD